MHTSCEPPRGAWHAAFCVTCRDAASWMRVLDVDARGENARCVDGDGRTETVATELVGAVARGDELLVHAGTALHRGPPPASDGEAGAGA